MRYRKFGNLRRLARGAHLELGIPVPPARSELAQTGSVALKKAENLAKRMPGAAALKAVADDEIGELEGVTILGQWSEVPDDFAKTLKG